MARARAAATAGVAPTALAARAVTGRHLNAPSSRNHRLRWIARGEMPLQRQEPPVEVREVVDPVPDLIALSADEVAQLAGDTIAVASRAQDGQLAS